MAFTTPSQRRAILAVVVISAIAAAQIHRIASNERKSLAESHQNAVADRQKDWARERVEREVKTLEATRARKRRHEAELSAALGGPAGAAAKNPNLTITQSIQQIAKACAPKGAGVLVQVNRFTEFSALIELPAEPDEAFLATLGQCILTQSSEYIHLIQFSFRGRLFAEIGRREIESVADFKKLSPSQMRQLLSAGSGSLIETPTPATNANEPEDERNTTQEMRLQKQAEETFHASLEAAHKNLNTAIDCEQAALDFTTVRRLADLAEKTGLLQRAETLSTQARAILEDPPSEYGRILKSARLNDPYIRSALRTAESRHQTSRAATVEMFNKHAARLQTAVETLDAFAKHFGKWTYNPEDRTYQFTTTPAHRDIQAALDRYQRDTQAFNTAITQQTEAIKAAQSP